MIQILSLPIHLNQLIGGAENVVINGRLKFVTVPQYLMGVHSVMHIMLLYLDEMTF